MIIGVLKESVPETRVSLLAESVSLLKKKGITVWVEPGAGEKSFCNDEEYNKAGAEIISAYEIVSHADIVLSINSPSLIPTSGRVLVGVYQPLSDRSQVDQWLNGGVTVFSLDLLPRTTRAQNMDVLSSQANIAGYKAVVLAASTYSRYFPMFMTAAGSIPPAKVLILGAGVAGLQAIATARRLGAVVEVFDTRPAVKEEVMSLGARFIEVEGAADASSAGGYAVEQTDEYRKKQQQRIGEAITKSDIVITTAQIPGKKAPILISEEMLKSMRAGSVIVDLAAKSGGNTPVTQNDSTVMYNGVSVIGNSNLPATMPYDASKLYGKNVINFLQLIISKENMLNLAVDDDLVKGAMVKKQTD